LLFPQLGCNAEESCICCPSSRKEVESFVEQVLPRESNHGADIVILDQNIDMSSEVFYLFMLTLSLFYASSCSSFLHPFLVILCHFEYKMPSIFSYMAYT